VLVTAFLVFPLFSFGEGRFDASKVIAGNDYWFVAGQNTSSSEVPLGEPNNPSKVVKHLGQISGYVFFLMPDNSTLSIVAVEKTSGLQIKHFIKEPKLEVTWRPPFLRIKDDQAK
jgi:hypothetical protein